MRPLPDQQPLLPRIVRQGSAVATRLVVSLLEALQVRIKTAMA